MYKFMSLVVIFGVSSVVSAATPLITDTSDWVTGLSAQDDSGKSSFSEPTTGSDPSFWNANDALGVKAGEYPKAGLKYLHTEKGFRTPSKKNYELTFPGATLGVDGGQFWLLTPNSVGVVTVDDFRAYSGSLATWTTLPTLDGTMTVYSPASAPFVIQARGDLTDAPSNTYATHLVVNSKILADRTYAGTDDVRLYLKHYTGSEKYRPPAIIAFTGDCSAYDGEFRVGNDVWFSFAGETPAKVIADAGSTLQLPASGTSTAGSIVLPSNQDVVIFGRFDGGIGTLATESLTYGSSGLVTVKVIGFFDNSCADRSYTLFEVPDMIELDGHFAFDASGLTNLLGKATGSITCLQAEGKNRIVLTTGAKIVTQTATDGTTTKAESTVLPLALDTAERWDPAIAPASADAAVCDYYVPAGMILRTREAYDDADAAVFPGRSLSVAGTFAMECKTGFDVGDLTMFGGSTLFTHMNGEWTISGDVNFPDKGETCTIECYGSRGNSRVHTFATNMSGPGDIKLRSHSGSGSAAGRAYFTGDNSGFLGQLWLTCPTTTGKSGDTTLYFPEMKTGFSEELKFDEAKNLGGTLDAFRHDALYVDQMSVLWPTKSVTLPAESNRGIKIGTGSDETNRVARFRTDAGVVFTVNVPITYNGILMKEGEGTLVLGGKALFGDGDEATAPVALNNRLEVCAGRLKVSAPSAVDGVAMTFDAGTSLVLPGDDTGFRNVKIDNPFDLTKLDGVLPVSFDPETCGEKRETTFGICTVSAEAAKGLSVDSFKVAKPWKGTKATVVKSTDSTTGYVTFSADIQPTGIVFVIR